ncbi:helix-turn-helix domain containing protein [Aliarcobacter cryaerophilus]|uniref:helix-turn-helix domain containing protein n=1 Tax=Aliarcobacter cryaerophilus TaxID=28198 RepID=UPI0021B59F9C|nr:helix-turn-helix domain containing protein [Aliarcobacter cryaerophilus]MCT7484918.1 helix-turn-helix domain containing protein [Aliarcobacter cryaerophilus]MCT7489912.1 helix-turn-helix domain containing protein [Aliarcobacter cryaerophilus]
MYDYDIEIILQRLLDYFDLDNMSQLADKLSVSQPTISKWKSRGSILPIKKICRELGIYNDIFGYLNTQNIQNQTIDTQNGINSFNNFAESNKQKIISKDILQDEEVIKVIKSITPIIEDDKIKKDDFIKYLKKWLIENI